MPFVLMEANWEYNDNTYDQHGFKPVKVYMTREKAVLAWKKAVRQSIAETDAITLGYGKLDDKTLDVLRRVEPMVVIHAERGLPSRFLAEPDVYRDGDGLEKLAPFIGRAVEFMTDDEIEHMMQCLEIDLYDIQEIEIDEE